MEVRVEGKSGPLVTNVDEVQRQVQQQLKDQQQQWVTQLRDHPLKFADLEVRIHQIFDGLADQVVAGVLAQVTAADDFADDAKKKYSTRHHGSYVLPRNDRSRCACWEVCCCG